MANPKSMRTELRCLAVAVSLGLAACGGSGGASSSASSTGTPTNSVSGTSSTAPTTSSTAPTTSDSTPSVVTPAGQRAPRCRASGLSLRFLGQQGAAGHGELGFALRNTTGGKCRTFGFPGILFLDRAGRSLPTDSVRSTHDLFGSAPTVSIVLAPGDSASFRIGVTHGIGSSAGCRTADAVQVIPPDDTFSVRTTIPNGAYECTQASISPLRPGESAYR